MHNYYYLASKVTIVTHGASQAYLLTAVSVTAVAVFLWTSLPNLFV